MIAARVTPLADDHRFVKMSLIGFLTLASTLSWSQATQPPAIVEYGPNITLDQAQKVVAAARNEASANKWTMCIAIVDTGGNLVLLERMDQTQVGSIDIALGKAKTANNFKRPTKVLEDAVAGGGTGLRLLSVPNVYTLEGGEPIIVDGKIIGAIGVSGMQSGQDEQAAKAGLAALKK